MTMTSRFCKQFLCLVVALVFVLCCFVSGQDTEQPQVASSNSSNVSSTLQKEEAERSDNRTITTELPANNNNETEKDASINPVNAVNCSDQCVDRLPLWKEEEQMEVIVNKCSENVTESWFQVPGLFQAPMSDRKKERILGRFRNGLFNFTLERKRPECVGGNERIQFELSIATAAPELIGVTTGEFYSFYNNYFSPYGDLRTDIHSFQYPPNAYCISSMNLEDDLILVEVCRPQFKHSNTIEQVEASGSKDPSKSVVFQKCCALGLVLRLQILKGNEGYTASCVESYEEEWTPFFYKQLPGLSNDFSYKLSDMDTTINGTQRPFYFHRLFDHCNTSSLYFLPREEVGIETTAEIRVLESGEILTRPTAQHSWNKPKQTTTRESFIDPDNMCVDGVIVSRDSDPQPTNGAQPIYKRSPANQILFYCQDNKHESLYTYSTIYFSMFCVTSVFLALVLVVYALTWKSQNIHGWTSAAFAVFVFLYHLSSALVQGAAVFAHQRIILFQSPTCIAIGILNLYSYVAMFSWMTVLNFDLWVTLSSMTPVSNRSKGTKRFLVYCAFALGIPLLVLIIALVVDSNFGIFDEGVIRPMIGRFACAVDNTAYVYYHSLPSLLIYLVNIFFAGMTIVSLYSWKKDTKRINKSNSRASQSQAKLMVKLFVLMGFSWIFDIISWFAAGWELTWYWGIFDCFNILQALALFWIFVCKKEVKDELSNNYEIFKVCLDFVDRASEGISKASTNSTTVGHTTDPSSTTN